MAINEVYRVRDEQGNVVGIFTSKKAAKVADNNVKVKVDLAAAVSTAMPDATDEARGNIVNFLLTNSDDLTNILKSIKDMPQDGDDTDEDQDEQGDDATNQAPADPVTPVDPNAPAATETPANPDSQAA
jgi:dsDNA-binding SOS-regulon protein